MYAPYSGTKRFSIQILSDFDGWILPYLHELIRDWCSAGHHVTLSHTIQDATHADFCFCLSFSQILPDSILKKYKHTLIVHESDLPQGRGWAPMTWQILEGKNRIPITLLEATAKIDAGPIYLQEWIELNGTELNSEWRKLQAQATQRLCKTWAESYPSIARCGREQIGEGTIYPRRRPEDSQLDPAKSLAEQFDLLRVVDNLRYPAYFEYRGERYKLLVEKWPLSKEG
ncbi:MAG: formyltransferase family protein [Desulfuromonadaceae bacterium]|nr:formyltransferase family protein [Desulfuromonadaceae bacterium]